VLRFLRPDFYASVLDPQVSDFKASALRYLDRADALLVPPGGLGAALWTGVSSGLVRRIPQFAVGPPAYGSHQLRTFVMEKLRERKL
jgi:hypothetical protein